MLSFRKATEADILRYFEWANDVTVRQNSINKSKIEFEDHVQWFTNKIANPNSIMLVFLEADIEIGQLRIEIDNQNKEAIINYTIDKKFRGRGLGTQMLSESYKYFMKLQLDIPLIGLVKPENKSSVAALQRAGFMQHNQPIIINNEHYLKFIR